MPPEFSGTGTCVPSDGEASNSCPSAAPLYGTGCMLAPVRVRHKRKSNAIAAAVVFLEWMCAASLKDNAMIRLVLSALLVAPLVASPVRAQPAGHPPNLMLDGAAVSRAGEAARTHLLGLVEFYSVALYAGTPVERARLLSADAPKALRIEIRYKDDFRRSIAVDWRHELIPRLEPAAIEHLRQAFAPLQAGDVVLIDYVPGKGTTVRVNKAVAATGAHHDLMLAFLDHWLGQRPVSEDMKRALVASS